MAAADVVGFSRRYSMGFHPSSPSSLLASSASTSPCCPARPVSSPYKRRNCLLAITDGPRRQLASFKAQAALTETDQDWPKRWERNAGPNMVDIHSPQEFLSALSQAGDKLVTIEFYGPWCASCKALFPKLCRTAEEHPEILFLKVNFDENKAMCKSSNVKVLPYFHSYRGADGQLESFSCFLAKKIKDAIQTHNTARCSIGPPLGVGVLNLESVP